LRFLEEKNIENWIVHKQFMPQLGDNTELETIIEIVIGVKESTNDM